MADVLTVSAAVAKAAQSAFEVGAWLYELIQQHDDIDEAIRDLAADATQLGNICESVDEHLKRLPNVNFAQEDNVLYSSIELQLKECNKSIGRLEDTLKKVSRDRLKVLKRTIRPVDIRLPRPIIDKVRNSVKSHAGNLQVSLQLINLKATYLAPKLANQELLAQLDRLQTSINEQGRKIDSALVQCAQDYISSATTLYEESVTGGSLIAPSKNTESIPQVVDWISNLNALRQDASGSRSSINSPSESSRAHTIFTPSTIDETETLNTTDDSLVEDVQDASPPPYGETDAELDFDDELAIDSTAIALESGRAAFDQQDFQEADGLLKEALHLIQALSLRLRSMHNLSDVHYKLAVCAFHLYDAATAEAALVTVVERQSRSNDDALNLCTAGHLLSQAYVRTGKLDLARSTCENAYRGRRKIHGKDHESCYESLALLARICELQSNSARAKVYLSMVPAERRSAQNFAGLNVEAGYPIQRKRSQETGETLSRVMSRVSIDTVATAESSQRLVSRSDVQAPSIQTARLEERLLWHCPRPCDLAWSLDCRFVACADIHTSEVYIIGTGPTATSRTIIGLSDKRIWSLALNLDGSILSIGYENGTVHLWDCASGMLRKSLAGRIARHHTGGVGSIAFSPKGDSMVSMCADGRILFFDLISWQLKHFSFDPSCDKTAGAMAFSPDSSCVAITSGKGANIWEIATGLLVKTIASVVAAPGSYHSLVGVAFTPDGDTLVLGSGTSRIGLHSIADSACVEVEMAQVPHPSSCFVTLTHSIKGDLIAAQLPPYGNETPWAITLEHERLVTIAGETSQRIKQVALSANGAYLASWAEDGSVRIWDLSKRLL